MEVLENLLQSWLQFILPYWGLIQLGFHSLFEFWWIFPPLIIILYLQKKYTDKDFYGLQITTGEFGAGKTYKNSLENKKHAENGIFIISNIQNSFVDLIFNSRLDLERVFTYLLTYAEITNTKEFIQLGFRPISFNIDEVHKYFFSRTFEKNINEENLMVMTQLRKRSILGNLITQELAQLDVFFRRLTGGIIKRYYEGLGFIRFWKLFYVANPENTNLEDEKEAKMIKRGIYLAPNFLLFLNKNRRELFKEKWVSKVIVGFKDELNNYSFTNFLLDLYPQESDHGKAFWKLYKKNYGDKQFLEDFEFSVNIEKRKKEIKDKYDEMIIRQKEKKVKTFNLKNLTNIT